MRVQDHCGLYAFAILSILIQTTFSFPGFPVCNFCSPGSYVVQKCSAKSGTVCAPCGNGLFSDKTNYLEACKPCTLCSKGNYPSKECNPTSDTVCSPCSQKPSAADAQYLAFCPSITDKVTSMMHGDDPNASGQPENGAATPDNGGKEAVPEMTKSDAPVAEESNAEEKASPTDANEVDKATADEPKAAETAPVEASTTAENTAGEKATADEPKAGETAPVEASTTAEDTAGEKATADEPKAAETAPVEASTTAEDTAAEKATADEPETAETAPVEASMTAEDTAGEKKAEEKTAEDSKKEPATEPVNENDEITPNDAGNETAAVVAPTESQESPNLGRVKAAEDKNASSSSPEPVDNTDANVKEANAPMLSKAAQVNGNDSSQAAPAAVDTNKAAEDSSPVLQAINSTQPSNETAPPSGPVLEPVSSLGKPANDTSPPSDNTGQPSNENPPVSDSASKPANDSSQPFNETAPPPPPSNTEAPPLPSANDTAETAVDGKPDPSNDTPTLSDETQANPPINAPPVDTALTKQSNQTSDNETKEAEDASDKALETQVRDVQPSNETSDLAPPAVGKGDGDGAGDVAVETINGTEGLQSPEGPTRIPTLEELEANHEDGDGSGEDDYEETSHEDHYNGTDDHHKGHVGKSHGNTDEDDENQKRTAIIVGVSVGAVAMFALLFFTSRKCRDRKDPKPKTSDDSGVEFQPLKQISPPPFHDPNANNGIYRHGPKMGPPSPRIHRKGEGQFEFPELHAAPKSRSQNSLNVPNASTKTPVSESPINEPLLQDGDQFKYIDESTDDEYGGSNVKDKLLPDAKLSQVVELSPPSSPATNTARPATTTATTTADVQQS